MNYKHAVSKGAKIFYHERGTGDPLVLLMGFGADGAVWEKHVAVYEKHFRCIVIDNRGVGRSDQPEGPYSTALMAADTIAVMDHAGVDKTMVAGISMGGAIAQELALGYPERVSKMILVCTWPAFNNYAKTVYENLKHVRSEVRQEYFMELLQLWIFAPPYYENNANQLKQDAKASAENKLQSRAGFEGQLDACINHNTTGRLAQLDLAVLITTGMMDIFTPPEFSYILHRNIKNSIISEYPTGGHVHHWEDLERFNRETLNFLLNGKI